MDEYKYKKLMWVFVVMSIVFLGVGGYFTYKYYDLKNKTEQSVEKGLTEQEFNSYVNNINTNTEIGKVKEINSEFITIINDYNIEKTYKLSNEIEIEKPEQVKDNENLTNFVTGKFEDVTNDSDVWLFIDNSTSEEEKVILIKIIQIN